MLEIIINRPADDVTDAVRQFVARRSYRLSRPWYLEDIRVEAPQLAEKIDETRGFWSSLTVDTSPPFVDVEVKKKRRGAIVKIKPGSHQKSSLIGYDLQAFLHDERVYDTKCPPVCPRCANGVPNPASRYCGRCGNQLINEGGSATGDVLRPPTAPMATRVDIRPPEALPVDFDHAPPIAALAPSMDVGETLVPPELDPAEEQVEPVEEPVAIERDYTIDEVIDDDSISANEIEVTIDDDVSTEAFDGTEALNEPEDVLTPPIVESRDDGQDRATDDDGESANQNAEAASVEDDEASAIDAGEEWDNEDDTDEPPGERRMLAED